MPFVLARLSDPAAHECFGRYAQPRSIRLPFAGAQLIFAPRSALMVQRYGPKAVCAVGMTLVALTVGAFLFVTAATPLWVLLLVFFVQGIGMANVIPPATEAVLSTLPREKAGVGSAVNNTMRQVGGALGVAVLGSVLSVVYRSQISEHLTRLPANLRDAASESIASTYAVAARMGGQTGAALIGPANDAYVQAMHWAAGGSAVAALAGAAAVIRWLPSQSVHQPAAPAPAPAAAAAAAEEPRLAEVS